MVFVNFLKMKYTFDNDILPYATFLVQYKIMSTRKKSIVEERLGENHGYRCGKTIFEEHVHNCESH